MATVYADGGYGYAATADTVAGRPARRARARARSGRAPPPRLALVDARTLPRPAPRGRYASPATDGRDAVAPRVVRAPDRRNRATPAIDPRIVDWEAVVRRAHRDAPARHQRRRRRRPGVPLPAAVDQRHRARRTATRSSARSTASAASASRAAPRCSRASASPAAAGAIAEEALELLAAPELPVRPHGRAADARPDDAADPRVDRPSARARPHPRRRAQLRRHELRHARHVRHYRYGSRAPQRDVRSDAAARSSRATRSTTTARRPQKTWLIRDGILERPLGGAISQARAGLARRRQRARRAAGTGRRSTAWRTSTSSPATSTLRRAWSARIERGVLMQTNCSWSIDDSRNKFQFGCERGRLIENGKLAEVVKNPNYRGISRELLAQPRDGRRRRDAARCSARRTAARASRRR